MILYRIKDGVVVDTGEEILQIDEKWDSIIGESNLTKEIDEMISRGEKQQTFNINDALVPVYSQEVWAAGVTYYRSRDARMAESEKSGGDSFYDRVYNANRPEIFFKGNRRTVVGTNDNISIRKDANWNVPEPELVLLANAEGTLIGCTIGNDVSSRDIEGENPLYLPQAKVYSRSCAIGPGILIGPTIPVPETEIKLKIERGKNVIFSGTTNLSELKRKPSELLEYLFRDNNFPAGCYLMTGTGIIPPDEFTLFSGDIVSITIEPIGTLINQVM